MNRAETSAELDRQRSRSYRRTVILVLLFGAALLAASITETLIGNARLRRFNALDASEIARIECRAVTRNLMTERVIRDDALNASLLQSIKTAGPSGRVSAGEFENRMYMSILTMSGAAYYLEVMAHEWPGQWYFRLGYVRYGEFSDSRPIETIFALALQGP